MSQNQLRLAIRKNLMTYSYDFWLTEMSVKHHFTFVMLVIIIQNYFIIRYNDQVYSTVTFSQIENDFVTQCPMPAENLTSILVLCQNQTEFDNASLYIKRILSQIGTKDNCIYKTSCEDLRLTGM